MGIPSILSTMNPDSLEELSSHHKIFVVETIPGIPPKFVGARGFLGETRTGT
jgi:hypothetical protein